MKLSAFIPPLGLLLIAGQHVSAAQQLATEVINPTTNGVPADNTSQAHIRVVVTATVGQPLSTLNLSLDRQDLLSLISPPTVSIVRGEADIVVQARHNVGTATLTIATPDLKQSIPVKIQLIPAPSAIDLQQLFAAVGSFVLVMLLASIAAEKATDFVKLCLTKLLTKPKEPMASLLGKNYQWLVMQQPPTIGLVWSLMCGASTAASRAKPAAQIRDIQTEDFRRQRAQAAWAWIWRLVAFVFGTTLAWLFNLDTFLLLSPLMHATLGAVHHLPGSGYVLTGFGASAGAAFWQDFFDKLTAWKKDAQTLKI